MNACRVYGIRPLSRSLVRLESISLGKERFLKNPLFRSINSGGDSNFEFPKIEETNPFDILGIPKSSSYKHVKQRFVELALKYHPDVAKKDEETDVEEFIRLRKAFEMIRESEDGGARLKVEGETNSMSDTEFQAWFYEETGHHDVMFKMDINTRKEVIDVVKNQSQGGLDKGGMWEMARTMAEQEESLKQKKLKFGKARVGVESSSESNARRRRKKK